MPMTAKRRWEPSDGLQCCCLTPGHQETVAYTHTTSRGQWCHLDCRLVLCGTLDPHSPLHRLLGNGHILEKILLEHLTHEKTYDLVLVR